MNRVAGVVAAALARLGVVIGGLLGLAPTARNIEIGWVISAAVLEGNDVFKRPAILRAKFPFADVAAAAS